MGTHLECDLSLVAMAGICVVGFFCISGTHRCQQTSARCRPISFSNCRIHKWVGNSYHLAARPLNGRSTSGALVCYWHDHPYLWITTHLTRYPSQVQIHPPFSGLLLTALTLLFGTNPGGIGPRLWLGCCDVYFQPSEPLKLLLIAYLAAYFADKLPSRLRIIHLLYPTLILSGVVIILLLAQRDLGTASIFIALYTIIIYLATGRRRVILISIALLLTVSAAGYYSVGIIHTRVDSWLNPWSDPGGSSYQIIQSMISIANGGLEGAVLGWEIRNSYWLPPPILSIQRLRRKRVFSGHWVCSPSLA